MLRSFRIADLPAYYELMVGEFPRENQLLGWRREPFFRIIRRLDRFPARLILGFLNLIGRPIFRLFVLEVDGAIAASALETFSTPSAYVGSVVVAPQFRRRGLARQVLEACHALAARRGMRFVTLDVLDGNDSALTLYRTLGYRPVGHGAYYRLDALPEGPAASRVGNVREFRNSDAKPVADIAKEFVSRQRQEIHPVEPGEFRLPPAVVRALESTSEAWVVDRGNGPVAWVRASVSPATEAGHLTAPVIAASADPGDVQSLLRTSLEWLRVHGAARGIVEVGDDNERGIAALKSCGFSVAFGAQTLALSIRGA